MYPSWISKRIVEIVCLTEPTWGFEENPHHGNDKNRNRKNRKKYSFISMPDVDAPLGFSII